MTSNKSIVPQNTSNPSASTTNQQALAITTNQQTSNNLNNDMLFKSAFNYLCKYLHAQRDRYIE
jgi:hypothetical protein